jgi:hypothetical protein
MNLSCWVHLRTSSSYALPAAWAAQVSLRAVLRTFVPAGILFKSMRIEDLKCGSSVARLPGLRILEQIRHPRSRFCYYEAPIDRVSASAGKEYAFSDLFSLCVHNCFIDLHRWSSPSCLDLWTGFWGRPTPTLLSLHPSQFLWITVSRDNTR